MKLTEIQDTVIQTIEEETTNERFLSIETLEQSLTKKNIQIGRQELFTVLSSLRLAGRLEFTGPVENFVYTINKNNTVEVAS